MKPIFSIVIPAYNQADFIAETLQSVLNQTFEAFEVLVVNDASTDHTRAVLEQFDDARLRVIEHPSNKGLPSARNTGMAAAGGKYIALLDADDLFLPEKLAAHYEFLEAHPEISVSYNARFDLHHSSNLIRDVYRPPLRAGLNDFIQGFMFAPSDMVVRADAAADVNYFDAAYICGGEDLDFPLRLSLAGHQFASVDRPLNYRRYHSGRMRKKLRCRIGDYTNAIEGVLRDPRCGEDTKKIINSGLAHHYSEVAWWALVSGDGELGNEIIQECIRLNPALAEGSPSKMLNGFFWRSIADHATAHEPVLAQIFAHLPAALAHPDDLLRWYCARGHLIKAALAVIWEQEESGKLHFEQARAQNAQVDASYIRWLTNKMLLYQYARGEEKTQAMIKRLSPYLTAIGGAASAREATGSLWVNRAFANFHLKNYRSALQAVGRAVQINPKYLLNRGVVSVAVRSCLHKLKSEPV